jgi:hypothetical protein
LLAADPDVYYVTDHYVGDAVLVRLSRVNPDVLRDLLGMAYKFVTRNAAPFAFTEAPPTESKSLSRVDEVLANAGFGRTVNTEIEPMPFVDEKRVSVKWCRFGRSLSGNPT